MRSCKVKIGSIKLKMCQFGSGNDFWLSKIAQFAVAGEWRKHDVHHERV
jgi:hypothetical protein